MMTQTLDAGVRFRPDPFEPEQECPHVLLVAGDQRTRYALADMLLNAGCRLTLCSTYDVADTLLDGVIDYDLLVAAQPSGAWGWTAQLARSATATLPILMLEDETASGPGVLEAVQTAIGRWPAQA